MANPILPSLEIRRFRAFEHLQIEKLGRVNLIVGKNNVGKSCLLEALQLYATRAQPAIIWQILEAHHESGELSDSQSRGDSSADPEEALSSIRYLFYGRKDIKESVDPIQMGPINMPDETLTLTIGFYTYITEEGSRVKRLRPVSSEEYTAVESPVPRLSMQFGKQLNIRYQLSPSSQPSRLLRARTKEITSIFVNANGVSSDQTGTLWDKIALTEREKDVLAALRIIAPGIEAVSIVGGPSARGRYPIVKVSGMDEPLPIGSLGDGMQRMLGIALALANAKDGIVLIDEIENGLHYSVQTNLWRLIFQMARKLNVQVFATSHSWDCVESFQKAAQEDDQDEGMLIRLEYKKDTIKATLFNEQRLAVATREQIEVR